MWQFFFFFSFSQTIYLWYRVNSYNPCMVCGHLDTEFCTFQGCSRQRFLYVSSDGYHILLVYFMYISLFHIIGGSWSLSHFDLSCNRIFLHTRRDKNMTLYSSHWYAIIYSIRIVLFERVGIFTISNTRSSTIFARTYN